MTLSKKQQKKQTRLQIKKRQQAEALDEELALEVESQPSLEPTSANEVSKPSFLDLAQRLVELSFACENVPDDFSKEKLHQWGERLAQLAFALQEASAVWMERLQTPNEKELRKKLHARSIQVRELQRHHRNAAFFSNMLFRVAEVWFTLREEAPHTTIGSIPGCLPQEQNNIWMSFSNFYSKVKASMDALRQTSPPELPSPEASKPTPHETPSQDEPSLPLPTLAENPVDEHRP